MKFPFARSPRQELCESPPTPDQCGPLSVVEFRKTLEVAIAAVAIKAPLSDSLFPPSFGRANPAFADPTVQRVMGVAMVQFKDHRLAFNFILRFIAMQKVIALPEMEPWMPESNGVVAAFHPAVFEAVAAVPMKRDASFDRAQFFAKVEQLASQDDVIDSVEPPGAPALQ